MAAFKDEFLVFGEDSHSIIEIVVVGEISESNIPLSVAGIDGIVHSSDVKEPVVVVIGVSSNFDLEDFIDDVGGELVSGVGSVDGADSEGEMDETVGEFVAVEIVLA